MLDWGPIILSLKLSSITTLILLVIAIPISYWLANTKSKFSILVETLVSLPLVLPPTVLGFYLLLVFSPNNFFGSFLDKELNIQLAFSFGGLVLASVIYSLPFMIQPIQSGFKQVPKRLTEASFVLGKSKWSTLRHVIIPNSKASLLTGIVLTFAHTLGEFGVVLMIGGNIPNQTRVASIAIFEEVEALNYSTAHSYSLILLLLCFLILLSVYWINGNHFKVLKL
jgi:molybdate transport system permease protein